jgi:hypothetical protein
MTGVNIFLRHQAPHVKNHPDAISLLQPERDQGGNMRTRMDHFDPFALD